MSSRTATRRRFTLTPSARMPYRGRRHNSSTRPVALAYLYPRWFPAGEVRDPQVAGDVGVALAASRVNVCCPSRWAMLRITSMPTNRQLHSSRGPALPRRAPRLRAITPCNGTTQLPRSRQRPTTSWVLGDGLSAPADVVCPTNGPARSLLVVARSPVGGSIRVCARLFALFLSSPVRMTVSFRGTIGIEEGSF